MSARNWVSLCGINCARKIQRNRNGGKKKTTIVFGSCIVVISVHNVIECARRVIVMQINGRHARHNMYRCRMTTMSYYYYVSLRRFEMPRAAGLKWRNGCAPGNCVISDGNRCVQTGKSGGCPSAQCYGFHRKVGKRIENFRSLLIITTLEIVQL